MKQKMVAPDGEVWEVPPTDMPAALAHKFVAYGSPEHMAQLGVKGPDANATPTDPIQPDSTARTIAAGLGKSAVKTGAGLLNMAGVKTPTADEFTAPANSLEGGAQTAGDIGQAVLPAAAASKVGAMMKLGKGLQSMRAVKAMQAAQVAARVGTNAAGTGVLTKAQGGDFSTGAMYGAAGGAGAELAGAAEPSIQRALATSRAKNIIDRATAYGGIGTLLGAATGHIPASVLVKEGVAATLLTKTGRSVARQVMRIAPGAFGVVKARAGSNSVDNTADSEGFSNHD